METDRGPEEQRAPENPNVDIRSCLMFLAIGLCFVGLVAWLVLF
jgi:hypothetical protein